MSSVNAAVRDKPRSSASSDSRRARTAGGVMILGAGGAGVFSTTRTGLNDAPAAPAMPTTRSNAVSYTGPMLLTATRGGDSPATNSNTRRSCSGVYSIPAAA